MNEVKNGWSMGKGCVGGGGGGTVIGDRRKGEGARNGERE